VLTIPADILVFEGTTVVNLLKIVALFSTLESLGYLGTRLVGAKKGLLIQGFCGGFISSTMTHLRITRNTALDTYPPKVIAQALLLSTVSMLFECIFIIYTLHPHAEQLVAPFIVQIIVLILAILFFQHAKSAAKSTAVQVVDDNDDPIIWKKMIYLSLFIIALTYVMRFISHTLNLPYAVSAFLVSLFEAHGVLVASMTEFSDLTEIPRATQVIIVVLAGNVISKTFFVMRSKRKDIRTPTLLPLYLSFIAAVVIGLSKVIL
jgi:uncharacterized membrane protein (DUF4010 family)